MLREYFELTWISHRLRQNRPFDVDELFNIGLLNVRVQGLLLRLPKSEN